MSENINMYFCLYFRLPDMLQLVGISKTDIAENLRKLVLSFELTASNVVLQTKDWTLVCLYLIKM